MRLRERDSAERNEGMLLYIVRHGETDWNQERRMQGEHDTPLNKNGKELARITARALEDVPFDLAISSPLSRALETARILIGDRKIPVLRDSRIREINWGEWDGIGVRDPKYSSVSGTIRLFYEQPFSFPGAPGGETIREVCKRTGEFYQDLIHTESYRDKTILVSTHGCAMRGILNQIYEIPENFWQEGVPVNCAVSIVRVNGETSEFIEKETVYYDKSLCRNFYHME